jgi:hypothetical protein
MYTFLSTRRGTRTPTMSPPPDFESGASTNSAIRALVSEVVNIGSRQVKENIFFENATGPVRTNLFEFNLSSDQNPYILQKIVLINLRINV